MASGVNWRDSPTEATHARKWDYQGRQGVDFYRRSSQGQWQYWSEGSWQRAMGTSERNCICRKDDEAEMLREAAPDLLDALKLVEQYVSVMKGPGHDYSVAVRAAIAKATRGTD